MRIGYIKKQKVPLKLVDKLKYFCNMIVTKEYQQGYLFQIPLLDQEEKMDKIVQNLLRKIRKAKVDTIVFSEECIHHILYPKIKESLTNENVLTGRKLMHYMNYEILEYILKIQKTMMGQEDIFFAIKKDDNLDLQFLSRFVENCKTVNIVTNDIERFKKVQENLYEKENILISVSNNKGKSLKRAKYILNVNMEKKELEKFKINRDAIMIHFKENAIYQQPTFNGIHIQYFQIHMPDEYIEQLESIDEGNEFDHARLYEAILFEKIEKAKRDITILSKEALNKHKNIVENMIQEDQIKITGLIGNNGRICEEELIQNYQKSVKQVNDKT